MNREVFDIRDELRHSLTPEEIQAFTVAVIRKARAGDITAMTFILSVLSPNVIGSSSLDSIPEGAFR